jgi:TetR/AcrR family transcriptional repressor of nem operon
MGRPREFDEHQALERATEVFWAKGYEAASLHDLTEAMGLSKSSLYETFGSKHELFLATIDHYNETVASRNAASVIAEASSPKAGIAAVFHGIIGKMAAGNGERRGCYIGNCAVEVAPHDPAAAAKVCNGLGHTEDAFYCAVTRAQEMGEIATARDARALARYLTSSLNGLIVMAKANPDREALDDVARIVLGALD